IISQPIKGTAKRLLSKIDDEKIASDLSRDLKERSENVMIVDLVRNDLSKTAKKSSVKVEELCKVYSFKQVHQMISTVVSEIDGVVSFGKIKRGNREIVVTSKDDQNHKYLIGLSKHVLVQDGDFVRAGTPLSDGAIAPRDILNIKGPFAVQQYLVNGVQEVYRSQGITINNKHIEVIVRQMMRRFLIEDSGDTTFLEGETVERGEFIEQNDIIFDKKFITDPGESNKLKAGQLVSLRQIREENSFLKRNDRKLVAFRDAVPATASPQLMGITKASLGTNSWISAASFQETTKVLSTAAIAAQKDDLRGLKENVIVGKRIPAGTGAREFEQIIVAHKDKSSELVTQAQFIDME
ncbi:MAG: chorismate-binding protein, partial [Saprospiraceae bacterium]|nr:chorismate-binding protein [Saprospiraceae bacterium]